MKRSTLFGNVNVCSMPKEQSQRCVYEIGMIAGKHFGIKPAVSRLQLLKSDKESFLKIDIPFVEESCLRLHFKLHYPLLVRGQTDSEYVYFGWIKFNLPFRDLNSVLVINFVLNVHWILIGLLDLLLCLRSPSLWVALRVDIVWIWIAILIKDVLGLAWPLSVCLLLMMYLIF